jgi:hypothetical protein
MSCSQYLIFQGYICISTLIYGFASSSPPPLSAMLYSVFCLLYLLDSPSIKVHVLHQCGPDGLFVRASGYTILEPIYMDCIRQWDSNVYNQADWQARILCTFQNNAKRCQMGAKTLYIHTEKEQSNWLIACKQLCDTSLEEGFGAASDITSRKPFSNSKHEAECNRNDST